MQIKVSDDRLSATVGNTNLRVTGQVTFKNLGERMISGTILAFAIIDKKDMAAPWMYVQENKTGDTDWISLKNWSELDLPSVKPIEVKTEIDENDLY